MATAVYWNPFTTIVKQRFLRTTFQIWTQIQQVMVFNFPAKGQLLLFGNNNSGPKLCCQLQNQADSLITDMKNQRAVTVLPTPIFPAKSCETFSHWHSRQ